MDELKTLKEIGKDPRFCSKLPMFARSELREMTKKEAIKHIKKIRLAKKWRHHNLSGNSGNAMFRQKTPKPKEKMSEEEINYYMQFGHLTDDYPRNWIKYFFNITEEEING